MAEKDKTKTIPQTADEARIDQVFKKHGLAPDVVLTDEMTEDEKDMAVFEGYLKKRYSPEEAAEKTKETLSRLKSAFKD